MMGKVLPRLSSLPSHRCEATGHFPVFDIADIDRKSGTEVHGLYNNISHVVLNR